MPAAESAEAAEAPAPSARFALKTWSEVWATASSDGVEPLLVVDVTGWKHEVTWREGDIVIARDTLERSEEALAGYAEKAFNERAAHRAPADMKANHAVLLVTDAMDRDWVTRLRRALERTRRPTESGERAAFEVHLVAADTAKRKWPADPMSLPEATFGLVELRGLGVSGPLRLELAIKAVERQFERFRRCYGEALGRKPELSGRLRVTVVLGVDGIVGKVDLGEMDMNDDGLADCFARAARFIRVDPPPDVVTFLEIPFVLTNK